MKRSIFLFCIIPSFFAACNSDNKNTAKQTTDTSLVSIADKFKVDTSEAFSMLMENGDTLLNVNLINDNTGSVQGYLGGTNKHVTLLVPVTGGDSIIAEIIPEDDTANIRFNQIYIPVGKTGKYDGPFSRKISYPVTVKGNYKLIIGENLMAQDNWQGKFTCKVLIK